MDTSTEPLPEDGEHRLRPAWALCLIGRHTWSVELPVRSCRRCVLHLLVVVAVSIAHVSLISAVQRTSYLLTWCQTGTLLVIVAVAAQLIVGILYSWEIDEELYLRTLGVLVILDVLGTIFMGVFALRNPPPKKKMAGRRRGDVIGELLRR